jgi:hypothetical protein
MLAVTMWLPGFGVMRVKRMVNVAVMKGPWAHANWDKEIKRDNSMAGAQWSEGRGA